MGFRERRREWRGRAGEYVMSVACASTNRRPLAGPFFFVLVCLFCFLLFVLSVPVVIFL